MTVSLYDLAGLDGCRFSPHCWTTHMALAHKGLSVKLVRTKFSEITAVGDGSYKTVPIIDDNGIWVGDSWQIASYLEEKYADAPSLFGSAAAYPLTVFARNWALCTLIPGIADLILHDVYEHCDPDDREFFVTTREKFFGRSLDAVQSGRESRVDSFRRSLHPLRMTIRKQAFLGGEQPTYADYQMFGPFMWARNASDFNILEEDDPIVPWIERCLDLFDGLARSSKAASGS